MKPESVVRHSAEEVLSWRHAPSWLLLAGAAGAVNAGAFTWAERFVSHVTGAVTRLGTEAFAWSAVLESGFLVISFVLGATASVLALQARSLKGDRPLHAAPLVVVAALVAGVGVAAHAGFATSEPGELALLGVLGLAMGLMNASVASSTALAVRTTHMTGPASDLGVHLGVAWFASGESRTHALRLAALRGGKLLAFIGGALAAVPLTKQVGLLSLLVPAALVLLATWRSFSPSPAVHPLNERESS